MDPRAECTNFLPSTVYASIPMFSTTTTITKEIDGESVSNTFPLHHFEPDRFLNGVLQVTAPVDSPTPGLLVIDRDISLPNGYMFSVMCFGGLDALVYVLDGGNIDPDFPLAILTGGTTELEEGSYATGRKMATFMVTRPGVEETGEYTLIHLDYPIPQAEVLIPEYPTQLFPIVEPPFDGILNRWPTWDYDSVSGKTLAFKDPGGMYNSTVWLPKYKVGEMIVPTLGAEYRLLNLLDGNISLAFEPPFALEPWFVYPYGYAVNTHQNINNLRERYPEAQFTLTGSTVTFNRGPSIEGLPPEYAAISFPLPQTWDGQHMSNGTRVKVRLDSIAEWNGMTTVYAGISSNQVEGYPWDNITGYETITVGEEKVYITDVGQSNLVLGSPGGYVDISDITFSVWLEAEPGVWLSVTDYYSYVKPIEHKLVTPQNDPYLYQGGYARVVVTDISYGGDTGSDITEIRWAVIGDLNN